MAGLLLRHCRSSLYRFIWGRKLKLSADPSGRDQAGHQPGLGEGGNGAGDRGELPAQEVDEGPAAGAAVCRGESMRWNDNQVPRMSVSRMVSIPSCSFRRLRSSSNSLRNRCWMAGRHQVRRAGLVDEPAIQGPVGATSASRASRIAVHAPGEPRAILQKRHAQEREKPGRSRRGNSR